MTEGQLQKANGLAPKIAHVKTIISALSVETTNPIGFAQTNSSGTIPNVQLNISDNEPEEFRKSIRVVLEATKQTIKSIYERELERLQREFENI